MSYPNHRYEFNASVHITTQGKGGFIQSIRHEMGADQWRYQLTTTGDRWWAEDELTTACPKCLSPVALAAPQCPACGFCLDN